MDLKDKFKFSGIWVWLVLTAAASFLSNFFQALCLQIFRFEPDFDQMLYGSLSLCALAVIFWTFWMLKTHTKIRRGAGANKHLARMIAKTEESLKVITKAGFTIYDLYESYLSVLKKHGAGIEIVFVDPENSAVIEYLDSVWNNHEELRGMWEKLRADLMKKLDKLIRKGLLDREVYEGVRKILENAQSHRDYIYASHILWLAAYEQSRGENEHSWINVYYYDSVPMVKEWIVDGIAAAKGKYSINDLGIDNPITFYHMKGGRDSQSAKLENCIIHWEYVKDSSAQVTATIDELYGKINRQ